MYFIHMNTADKVRKYPSLPPAPTINYPDMNTIGKGIILPSNVRKTSLPEKRDHVLLSLPPQVVGPSVQYKEDRFFF